MADQTNIDLDEKIQKLRLIIVKNYLEALQIFICDNVNLTDKQKRDALYGGILHLPDIFFLESGLYLPNAFEKQLLDNNPNLISYQIDVQKKENCLNQYIKVNQVKVQLNEKKKSTNQTTIIKLYCSLIGQFLKQIRGFTNQQESNLNKNLFFTIELPPNDTDLFVSKESVNILKKILFWLGTFSNGSIMLLNKSYLFAKLDFPSQKDGFNYLGHFYPSQTPIVDDIKYYADFEFFLKSKDDGPFLRKDVDNDHMVISNLKRKVIYFMKLRNHQLNQKTTLPQKNEPMVAGITNDIFVGDSTEDLLAESSLTPTYLKSAFPQLFNSLENDEPGKSREITHMIIQELINCVVLHGLDPDIENTKDLDKYFTLHMLGQTELAVRYIAKDAMNLFLTPEEASGINISKMFNDTVDSNTLEQQKSKFTLLQNNNPEYLALLEIQLLWNDLQVILDQLNTKLIYVLTGDEFEQVPASLLNKKDAQTKPELQNNLSYLAQVQYSFKVSAVLNKLPELLKLKRTGIINNGTYRHLRSLLNLESKNAILWQLPEASNDISGLKIVQRANQTVSNLINSTGLPSIVIWNQEENIFKAVTNALVHKPNQNANLLRVVIPSSLKRYNVLLRNFTPYSIEITK